MTGRICASSELLLRDNGDDDDDDDDDLTECFVKYCRDYRASKETRFVINTRFYYDLLSFINLLASDKSEAYSYTII